MLLQAKKKTQTPELSTPQARGKRLKLARQLTGLARKELEKKYNISANTIQSWEVAKKGGLTKQGAERIVTIIQKEGVDCSVEWLLYGSGSAPRPAQTYDLQHHPVLCPTLPVLSEKEIIQKELDTFCLLHPNALHTTITENSMEPYYKIGDCVAGSISPPHTIDRFIGKHCIIQTGDEKIIVRQLKSSKNEGFYDLISINPATTAPYLPQQKVINIANILWHRRPNPS